MEELVLQDDYRPVKTKKLTMIIVSLRCGAKVKWEHPFFFMMLAKGPSI